jgi:curved DNA-binding protein CbpA
MSSNIEDLIGKMNPKKNPEEIDMNKKQSSEKFKPTITEVSIDYYAILGVAPTATHIEIKRAYTTKLKKLHPDKVEQTKENKEKYKLLREAGDLLTDPLDRKAYDAQKKVESSSLKDFKSAQESFKEFLKLQEQNMTEEDKNIAKLNFEQGLASFDRKHGYNKKDADKISEEEHKRRVKDMELQRQQEEIELQQDNLFKDRDFNPSDFNKMFEKKKRRDEKRKTSGLAKIGADDIAAFNDVEGDSGGVGIDQYDNLYSQGSFGEYNANYAGIGSGMVGDDNGASEDEISIDSPNEDEYDNHRKGVSKEALDAEMKRMMSERETQNTVFEKFSDNKQFGSALDDKYGISSQFGFMVGTDLAGNQKNIKKRNVKEETLKAYKKLAAK